jgi:glycosyltransferase involved in cell wall biosynthesis
MSDYIAMKIAYYMPFKPLGHPNPSGDLVLGTEIYNHLNQSGHDCRLASRLRCRWIYLHPLNILKLIRERYRVFKYLRPDTPDLWLSYHSYYKAPDLLGPYCARKLGIPYVIFQGIYSTKRKRQLKTIPGFYLNRQALTAARMTFTNKRHDEQNLLRLLPPERVCYIAPGIHTRDFTFSAEARNTSRRKWGIKNELVVMAAAMFRPGVKTRGLQHVIKSCADLVRRGRKLRLVITGDGKCRDELHALGNNLLAGNIIFTGQIPRNELYTVYSGADIFAFPGIEESLGMVYLEAQSCGLPVVAFQDWGGKEATVDGKTGLLSPASAPERFTDNIDRLLLDDALRKVLGEQAARHVRTNHELATSYSFLEKKIREIAGHSG